ncbi:unnamed protein product [Ectocarpus sp. 12 AP-2014]
MQLFFRSCKRSVNRDCPEELISSALEHADMDLPKARTVAALVFQTLFPGSPWLARAKGARCCCPYVPVPTSRTFPYRRQLTPR